MKKILIIDDDPYIGAMLEEILTKAGYEIIRAYSGTEAILLLSGSGCKTSLKTRPDLVLLDLMLPGLSGEEVLPRMKGIPVIVVSAKAGIDHKVDLLLGGAMDYVTKPFDIKELLARITVALRNAAVPSGTILSFDELRLDTMTHEVSVDGRRAGLTRTEYAILKMLMQNPTQVLAKSLLLDHISADTPDCTESSLKMHVSNLRKKLRDLCGKSYIEAVWGIGFRLTENKSL